MKEYMNHPVVPKLEMNRPSLIETKWKPYESKLAKFEIHDNIGLEKPNLMKIFDKVKKNLRKLNSMKTFTATDLWDNKAFSSQPFERKNSYQFIRSAKLNDLETVQDLLKRSPFLIFDFDHLHMTALHWAAKKGHHRLAEYLI